MAVFACDFHVLVRMIEENYVPALRGKLISGVFVISMVSRAARQYLARSAPNFAVTFRKTKHCDIQG